MLKSVSLNDLFLDFKEGHKAIVKIDIEGGEEHLLQDNTDWVSSIIYMTAEVHDRFHPVMLNSSKNLLRVLSENDFAIAAEKDVLHCYSRKHLFA